MPVDVKKFVTDLDDVSAEDKATLERIMSGSKKAQEAVMRQSDYDRYMNEGKAQLAKDRTALENSVKEREAAVEAEAQALAQWKKDQQDGPLKQAQDAVAAATAREAAAKAALERAITDAGLERDTYLKDLENAKPDDKGRKEPPVVDDKGKADDRYVGKERFERGVIGAVATAAELADLQNEHMSVFGKPLTGVKALVDETMQRAQKGEQVSLRSVWEEKHKVPDALKAKSDAEIAQRIKDAEEAAYRRGRSEAAIGAREASEEAASPVLKMAAKNHEGRMAGVSPGVAAAVADYEGRQAGKKQAGA